MSLVFPIGAILVMVMLAIVPWVFSNNETVLTYADILLVGSGVVYYIVVILWKKKPKSYTRAMGNYENQLLLLFLNCTVKELCHRFILIWFSF
jgi:hypothetical protein